MILSESKAETLKTLENLRRQVDLLDSHKTVGLISDKQYAQSLAHIVKKIEDIEDEYGVEHPREWTAFDLLFGESMDKYKDMMSSFDAIFGR